MSHASGFICYCVSAKPPDRGWMLSLKALPLHAVYDRNLCAPPAEGSHFYRKLSCSLVVSFFPTCFFDSLLLSQSHLSHGWYHSINALTWPLSERLARSWTWHRGNGLVFLRILSNVFLSPRAPANNAFLEGAPKSFDDARWQIVLLPGRCGGWHAEIWQAFIARFSVCWLHECTIWQDNMGGSFLQERGWVCKWQRVLQPGGGVGWVHFLFQRSYLHTAVANLSDL